MVYSSRHAPAPAVGAHWLTGAAWSAALGLVIVAGVALHGERLKEYTLYKDDWSFVAGALTPQRWRASIWQFHAQHCLPAFRTVTALLCWASPDLPHLPDVLRWGPILAYVCVGLMLAHVTALLTGSRLAALTAAGLFSVTSVHAAVLRWYSASVATWSAACLLLAVASWFRFCQRGGLVRALVAAAATVLAPAFWSTGVLVAPVLAVTLGSSWCFWAQAQGRRRMVLAIAVSFAVAAGWYVWLQELRGGQPVLTDFEGRPFREAFRVELAMVFTLRAVAEKLILGNLSIWDPRLPPVPGVVYGAAAMAAVLWLWRRRRLSAPAVLAGLSMVLFGFGLPYAFRANVGYAQLRAFDWYACLPQCGAALIAGAIVESFLRFCPGRAPKPARVATLLAGAAVLAWISHRSIIDAMPRSLWFPRQRAQLAELQLVETLAHRMQVSEASLRRVLPHYRLDGAPRMDGLELLDLPQQGRDWPTDALRRIVAHALEYGTIPAGPP